MKKPTFLASLICAAAVMAQTTGQFIVPVKTAGGRTETGVTLSNGEVIGKLGGVPAAISLSSYLTSDSALNATNLTSGTLPADRVGAGSITLSKLAASGATTGQVVTWNGSVWAPATPSGGGGGSGLDNVASTITGGTLTLAGTLTAGRTLTVRDLSGTIALTSDLSAYLTTSSASSTYEPILTAGTTGQYYRGDKSWQTLNAAAVGLGNVSNALQLVAANNLSDLTNATTARSNLGLGTLATQNGTISDYLTTATAASTYEPIIAAGTTGQYWRGDKSWQTLNASAVGLGNVSNALQLVAANNLSDLANAAAARVALGVEDVVMGAAQVVTVTISGPAQTSWAGEYVDIDDAVEVCRFWFTVDGSGSAPSAPSSGRLQMVAVNDADSVSVVETAFLAAFASQSASFTAVGNGFGAITVTNTTIGDAANPSTTFGSMGVAVITGGSDTITRLAPFNGSQLTDVTADNLALTLPIEGGGTGQTSQTAAFDALAPTTTKGDLIVSNGTDNVRLAVGATNGHVLTVDSSEATGVKWAAAGGGSATTDNRLYTADDTWTNPSPSTPKRVFVRLVGAGGGGGGGRKGAAGSVRCGGGGGGGACVVEFWALTTDLGTTLAVTVGAGGLGGAGQTTNNSNGNAGTAGGGTTFNSVTAYGGNPGSGGTTASGAGGTGVASGNSIGLSTTNNTQTGGAASTTGLAGAAGATSTIFVPTGGGAGGGINTSNAASNGGAGGPMSPASIGQALGGTGGTSGGNGGVGNSTRGSGTGGGGGASSITGNAGSGGNGGGFGAGGGGGGAAVDDTGNSGAGGNGASGYALIITYL